MKMCHDCVSATRMKLCRVSHVFVHVSRYRRALLTGPSALHPIRSGPGASGPRLFAAQTLISVERASCASHICGLGSRLIIPSHWRRNRKRLIDSSGVLIGMLSISRTRRLIRGQVNIKETWIATP